jgi:hypothetical protein
LRHFGPHASRIARLIWLQPSIAQRLLCAPTRAIHAVGIYLHYAALASDAEVADHLARVGPRQLLSTTFPSAPPQLYRLLDRAGDRVASWEFYESLAEAAAGPLCKVLFASEGRVDEMLIRHLATLKESDPALRRLPPKLLADKGATSAITAVLSVVRAYGGDGDRVFANLPESVGVQGIYKRLVEQVSLLEAAPAPSQLPREMQQIMTIGALRDVGKQLNLCVAKPVFGGAVHWMRLLDGQSIYILSDAPTCLIEMRRVAPGCWTFGDIRREENRQLAPAAMRAVTAALRAAGWSLVSVDPAEGLSTLATRSDSQFQIWQQTLGDALGEMDHEGFG